MDVFFARRSASTAPAGVPEPPSASDVARVRAAGADLRTRLTAGSFGSTVVLSVELMQTLVEAFGVFACEDVTLSFGVSSGWDVLAVLLSRRESLNAAIGRHYRQADSGRRLLRWLAQSFLDTVDLGQLGGLLADALEPAQEWLACAVPS